MALLLHRRLPWHRIGSVGLDSRVVAGTKPT